MKSRTHTWLMLFAFLFASTTFFVRPAAADEDDPPGRVARLSVARGQVSFNPAGTDDWVSAVVNRPITTGDKLWTDRDARAELHVGSAAFRLAGETGFSFLNLSDQILQVQVTEGTLNVRVRRLEQDESIEIDTPNLAFSVLRPGNYRINVNEAGDTTIITVRDGQGEVTGGGSAYTVRPGDQGYFTGTDSLNADIEPRGDDDDFDRWSNDRDLREEHAVARRYVSDDVIGYEDLDEYGGWRPTPEYGTVWFPHVTVVGWAPYRYGHWAWVAPWGWTWVDDAPWGFAPFHYGRWVNVYGAWGWVPCPPRTVAVAYVRPVYAPALVAWVGGPHFAVGVGVGAGVNVGWFPLGPREVFVPSYHVSRTYVNNVNISNTTVNQTVVNNYYNTTVINKNVTNVRYVNQSVSGAVTATSGQNFTSARPVANNMIRVNEREIASAPVAVSAPSVVPPKQAVIGAGASTNIRPPAAVVNRAVVAKVAPPPPPPAFEKQQAAVQANQGRPISMSESRQLQPLPTRAAAAPVKIAPPATAVVAPRGNNPRGNQQGNAQGNAQQGANRGGQPQNQNNPGRPPNNVSQPNNQPAQVNNNRPPSNAGQPTNNAPQATQQPAQVNSGRPPSNPVQQPNNTAQPTQQPAQNNPNRPPNTDNGQPAQGPNPPNNHAYDNRPPSARPNTVPPVNPQLEEKHVQQNQQLQQKQDQERQRLEQQQRAEQQRLQQQRADEAKQQQIQQRQQQQLQQLEQKHDQQQQQLNQKQQVEHNRAEQAPKPKENKSKEEPKDDKSKSKPSEDHPHNK